MQDNAAPWEMFNCLLHSSGTEMRRFLRSPQLRHWYTQNFDLLRSAGKRVNFRSADALESACTQQIGLDPQHDSDIDPVGETDLVAKVSPIPIGIGLDCQQLPAWRAAVGAAPPLHKRRLEIAVPFSHSLMRDRRKTALRELHSSHSTQLPYMTTSALWGSLSTFAFVAAPASRGQDTFRFWEAILLGSIPIVQAGPLDTLYAMMPCVIVSRWDGISASRLDDWRSAIIERFGPVPQQHPHVQPFLNGKILGRIIQEGIPMPTQKRASGLRPVHHRPRAVINHTCNMSVGGLLTLGRRELLLGCGGLHPWP